MRIGERLKNFYDLEKEQKYLNLKVLFFFLLLNFLKIIEIKFYDSFL